MPTPTEPIAKTRPPLLVAGAAGHAAVVIEIVRAQGRYAVIGCTAAAPDREQPPLGVAMLGDDERFATIRAQGVRHAIVAIGDNRIRLNVGAALRALGFTLASAVHPAAIVSPSATLGEGAAVMAGAVVNARASIGDLAILNTRCGIDHDCALGEGVHVAPGATLAGSVRLGEGAFVGAGATLVPGLAIGAWSVVGAGSLVLRDVDPGVLAFGVPAHRRTGQGIERA